MIDLKKATEIVREYFLDQCENTMGAGRFRFTVNGAALDPRCGFFVVWCTHACPFVDKHHRVAVDAKTGKIMAVQRRPTAEVEPGNGL